MGTLQFPDLGKHCSVDDCKQIDFLPFTCDRCIQVFCLDHRSYNKHQCPKGDRNDVTVIVCPLCAKGVRLNLNEDPNITWESHANQECDPSNYEKVTKKKKCPAPGCREVLTFSNTIRCRDCMSDHCLKHRFGLDHSCPGSKKAVPVMGLLNRSRKEDSRSSTPKWGTSFLSAASSLKAGITKLSSVGQSSSIGNQSGQAEQCPQCNGKFSSVIKLVDHVQKVHERSGGRVIRGTSKN